MSNLTDYVERLSTIASTIANTAIAVGRLPDNGQESSSTGPFTRAVLQTPLGDLIRDIDPSEIGLFTLVQSSTHARPQTPQEDAPTQKVEVARVSLPVATPLRKPPSASNYRRQDGQRPGEYEPEIYANAALKFLDQYQSIRHMPRYQEQAEQLVSQLAAIRQSLSSLTEELKQAGSGSGTEPQLSPISKLQEEERLIESLNAKKLELEKRKYALQQRSQRTHTKAAPKARPVSTPRSPPPPDEREETFWNTPSAAARTLHFTDDLLTDEQIDIGDVSALASPLPGELATRAAPRRVPRAGPSRGRALQFTRKARREGAEDVDVDGHDTSVSHRSSMTENSSNIDDSDSDDNDTTVILDKPAPPAPDTHAPIQRPTRSVESASALARKGTPPSTMPPPMETAGDKDASRAHDVRKTKSKVTADAERIVAKIWTTIGDVVMPGHAFDPSGSKSGPNPPKAKETIAHLESLASQTPSIASPSASSISFSTLSLAQGSSDKPTAQLILTAHMLLALLNSPPSYTMPLNKLREVLSAAGAQGTSVTRPIYSCVAKKLLKIERGGGEQIVKFDV